MKEDHGETLVLVVVLLLATIIVLTGCAAALRIVGLI